MLAISQLLLTRFWWNFKGRFIGTFRTDFNYQVDICLGNICLGKICSYQDPLSCYWPNVDQTLKVGSWEHLEQILTVTATFVLVTIVHIRNISAVTDPMLRFLEPFFNRCQPLCWYLSSQHLCWQHLSILGISQLLLAQFLPNFKSKGRSQIFLHLNF